MFSSVMGDRIFGLPLWQIYFRVWETVVACYIQNMKQRRSSFTEISFKIKRLKWFEMVSIALNCVQRDSALLCNRLHRFRSKQLSAWIQIEHWYDIKIRAHLHNATSCIFYSPYTGSTTSCLTERPRSRGRPVRPQIAESMYQYQPAISYPQHESSRLSAPVNTFLHQPVSALQHGSSEVYYWTACVPEIVAKNFSASFQENRFQVDKIYITWPTSRKQRDHCETKSQTGNELCW
jgi:hypothetical protein